MTYFTTKGGVKLFYNYHSVNNKPTLVFVHGLAANSNVWRSYINKFKGEFSVLSFDLRGHGNSSRTESYPIENFSKDLRDLVKHLKIQDHFLFGYSLGGLIVSDYIDRYNIGPKGVVLISPLAGYGDSRSAFLLGIRTSTLFPSFIFKFCTKFKFLLSKNLYSYISSLAKTSHKAILKIVNGLKDYGSIKKVNGKKLIIIAEKDQLIKNEIKKVYSDYVSINSDHLAIIKEDKKIDEIIDDFLKNT